MATTCKPEGAATIDPNNPNNIIVTFAVRDASNAVVQTQAISGAGKDWTANKAKFFSEQMLNSYLDNQAAAAAASTNLPAINTFIAQGAVLASK